MNTLARTGVAGFVDGLRSTSNRAGLMSEGCSTCLDLRGEAASHSPRVFLAPILLVFAESVLRGVAGWVHMLPYWMVAGVTSVLSVRQILPPYAPATAYFNESR